MTLTTAQCSNVWYASRCMIFVSHPRSKICGRLDLRKDVAEA